MKGKTILGVALLVLGAAYVAGALLVLKEQPNLWLSLGLIGGGAYLLEPVQIAALADKAKELKP